MIKELEEVDFKNDPWTVVDEALKHYDAKCASRDYVLGNGLLDIDERQLWREALCSSLADYFQKTLGWDPHTTAERKRTARALKSLPLLTEEMKSGRIRYSHVREITRSANAKNEQEWIDFARGKTAQEVWLHAKVRGPDASPNDPAKPELLRKLINLECDGEEWAFLMNIIDDVRRTHGEIGTEMSRAKALVIALREKMSIEVHAEFCPGCREGGVATRFGYVPVTTATIDRYVCEGRVIGPDGKVISRHIPTDVHRAAMHRAGARCEVPGCRHRWFINVHHLKLFSEGGTHALSNLVVLCSLHHGLIHAGVMWVVGDRETGLTFTHADGTKLGEVPNQTIAEAVQSAFEVLVSMGNAEGLVRDALEEVRGDHHLTVEKLLEAVGPVLARLAKQRREAQPKDESVVAEMWDPSHVGLITREIQVPYRTSHVGRKEATLN